MNYYYTKTIISKQRVLNCSALQAPWNILQTKSFSLIKSVLMRPAPAIVRRKLATAQRFLVPSVARRERGDAPEGFGGGCALTTLRVSNNLDGAGRISRNQSDRCPLYGCVVLSWLREAEEIFCLCFNFPTDWTDNAKKPSVTSHVTDRE